VPALPAVCDSCSTVFPSGFSASGSGSGTLAGNESGPCPNCGGMGSVPDGFYEITNDAITVFSTWPVERLQALEGALRAAQQSPDPGPALREVLSEEPGLADVAGRLSSIRDPPTVIAFVTMLLTAIMLLTSHPGTTIDYQTVIQSAPQISQPASPSPTQFGQRAVRPATRRPANSRVRRDSVAWAHKRPRNNAHRHHRRK
jgi:hypothetical protein